MPYRCCLLSLLAAASVTVAATTETEVPSQTIDPADVATAPIQLPEPPAAQRDWKPSGELASLLKKMTDACEASQKVFKPLSAEQMNWSPPNGTHTPRWNVEHMSGAQLRFFSQVYAAIDPQRHKPISLSPKQMPADYQPARPDWTGAQEAEWMARVNAYVVSHAYLLEDLDLEAPAPGSRWKPGQLMLVMERHFNEHTANVEKKFELPEWPRE